MDKQSKQSREPSLAELLEEAALLQEQEQQRLAGPRQRLASSGRQSDSTDSQSSDGGTSWQKRLQRAHEIELELWGPESREPQSSDE